MFNYDNAQELDNCKEKKHQCVLKDNCEAFLSIFHNKRFPLN